MIIFDLIICHHPCSTSPLCTATVPSLHRHRQGTVTAPPLHRHCAVLMCIITDSTSRHPCCSTVTVSLRSMCTAPPLPRHRTTHRRCSISDAIFMPPIHQLPMLFLHRSTVDSRRCAVSRSVTAPSLHPGDVPELRRQGAEGAFLPQRMRELGYRRILYLPLIPLF